MNTNDDMVNQLAQSTGCDFQLASLLLKFTGGDINGAKRIVEAVPKDIYAVKAKFVTQITGYFGAFFFCYDERENRVRRFISVVTGDKEIGKLDIKRDWRSFEEEIYRFARERGVDGLKIEQIKKRLTDSEFISKVRNILKYGESAERSVTHNLFVDELYNVFADTNIAVKFDIEMTDAFELNKGQMLKEDNGEKKGEAGETESVIKGDKGKEKKTLIVLDVEPVLSPVRGVPAKKLEYGDEIQVKIVDEKEIADYLAELLGGKIDNLRIPIFTRVVEIKELESGNLRILTQFGPGIVGTCKVPSYVKVNTNKDITYHVSERMPQRRDINPLFVIGGIVIVVVLFILLIILSR